MSNELVHQIAAIHTSSAIAFGCLAKAVAENLPEEAQLHFVESITAQLRMHAEEPEQPPNVAKWLAGYRTMAAALLGQGDP